MSDEAEAVKGEVEDGPMPEAAAAIEELMAPPATDLVLRDPDDVHESLIVLDAHDVAAIVRRAQSSAIKKWVYELPDNKRGLSIDGVQDVTQQMNWTGKCRIGLLPDTLEVEQVLADEGRGDEPFWVATVFARDEVTGATQSGSSMEPQRMQLTEKTARAWRERGKSVPDDRLVFDRFARTKAINKAERNAMAKFIPEEVEQTIIAMYANDPTRVERIQTEAEAKLEELPAPLTDDKAKGQIKRCEELYDRIRELGGGQGRVKFPPGRFSSWMLRSQHDHDALDRFIEYLEEQLVVLDQEIKREALERLAVESVLDAVCPKCGARETWRCKTGRKNDKDQDVLSNTPHPERLAARLAELSA